MVGRDERDLVGQVAPIDVGGDDVRGKTKQRHGHECGWRAPAYCTERWLRSNDDCPQHPARAGRAVPAPVSWPPLGPDAGVTVVIPTKNEEGLIAEIIEAARPHAAEILVVDGHSTDRTREIASAKGARVVLDGGRGKGEALRRSFVEARHDILVFIDADGSHDPKDIPLLDRADPPGRGGAGHRLAHARRQRRAARHRRAAAALHRLATHHARDQLPLAGEADRQPEWISGASPRRRARTAAESRT